MLGDKKEDKLEDMSDKLGDKGEKASGRQTHHLTHRHTGGEIMGDQRETRPWQGGHHPTQAHMWGEGDNRRPREGGHTIQGGRTIQHRHTCRETMGDYGRRQRDARRETMGDNDRQWEAGRRPWEGGHAIQHRHTLCGDNGRQGKKRAREGGHQSTKGNKKGDGRQQETMGDKGRQDLRKVDAPSNTGTHVGRQRETRGAKTPGRYKHTCGETMGDKTSGRGDTPSQALGRRDKGRQGEHTCGETMGDKGTQGLGKANTPANTCWKTMGDKGRPSNTGTNVGRHCETMGGKTSGRRTHHPTQARMRGEWEKRGDKTLGTRTRQHRHMWGDGRQGETRRGGGHTIHQSKTKGDTWGDKTSGRWTHHPTQAHICGDKGRQDLGRIHHHKHTCGARPQEGGHCEAMGDKTSGKTDTPPQSLNGRQGET